MKALEIISSYTRYAYLIVIVVLVVLTIRLLSKLNKISQTMGPVNDGIRHMNKDLSDLNDKKTVIDDTLSRSIPFFVRIFFALSVLGIAFNDFFSTKASKRNLNRSLQKAYRYEKLLRENKALKKASR